MFDRHLESLQFKKLWLRRSKLCVKLRDKINTSYFNRLSLICDMTFQSQYELGEILTDRQRYSKIDFIGPIADCNSKGQLK